MIEVCGDRVALDERQEPEHHIAGPHRRIDESPRCRLLHAAGDLKLKVQNLVKIAMARLLIAVAMIAVIVTVDALI